MKTLTISAVTENLDAVQSFIDEALAAVPCSAQTRIQLQIAVEELFVNIASYAYNPEVGEAVIGCNVDSTPPCITIQFRDRGVPFDPLARKDADITLSADERGIGGLGIYMVKDYMDEVVYTYEDGQNVLTLRKNLT